MRDLFIRIGLLLQNYTLAQRFIFVFAGITMLSSLLQFCFGQTVQIMSHCILICHRVKQTE